MFFIFFLYFVVDFYLQLIDNRAIIEGKEVYYVFFQKVVA